MQGYLLINPNGNRTWYLRYRFPGKESNISFGAYPTTSLTEARDKQMKPENLSEAKSILQSIARLRVPVSIQHRITSSLSKRWLSPGIPAI
ncbi:Arm DNA-binding domain-containing protein [Klebsiella aerogenes]